MLAENSTMLVSGDAGDEFMRKLLNVDLSNILKP